MASRRALIISLALLLAACGGGGAGGNPAALTVTLEAAPVSVVAGNAATLTWSSSDTTDCTATGDWSGSKAVSGSQSTGVLASSASFTLTCNGADGSASDAVDVTVVPIPVVNLTVAPQTVDSGQAATLTWSSANATACTASGSWNGSRPLTGSQSTGALSGNVSYTLTCSGAGGSASRTATVAVNSLPGTPTVTLAANPSNVIAGNASTLTWSSTNATSCTASGGWTGSRATSGTQGTGSLNATTSYTLTCNGPGGSANQTATVTTTPPLPTVSLSVSPGSVASGNSSTLTWSTTNATACTASNGWSGARATSGTASTGALAAATTYALNCTGPGGSANRSVTVTVTGSGAVLGLDFPGSAAVATTMRFRFFNPLAIFPATYIWRAYPRQQNGYYTAFFWGNDDGNEDLSTFLWAGPNEADSFYGAHPYPDGGGSGTPTHQWEIAVQQADFVNGVVVYDRWYTQALRVWADGTGRKHHEFYWDLPNTDAGHMVSRTTNSDWGNRTPPVPALTWGDAPWAPGREVWNGILRGIQVYSTDLSVPDILTEANAPLSTPSGAANVWYLNLNPTPSDISDQSGEGHNPEWVGTERPTLWTGP